MNIQPSPKTDGEVVPEGDSLAPITIRTLDRLETTRTCFNTGG